MKRKIFLSCIILFCVLFLLIFPIHIGGSQEYKLLHIPLVFRGWPPPPPPARLVLSEVMINPTSPEPDGEWIEVYNSGGLQLDVSEYKIGDEETRSGSEGMFQFPSGTIIHPGEVVVIASKGLTFKNQYGVEPNFELRESDPNIPNMIKYTVWSGGNIELNNGGDEVLILDNIDENIVDAVSWGSSIFAFDPSVSAPGDGISIERVPVTSDSDSATDWKAQAVPIPGQVVLPTQTPTASVTPSPSITSSLTATSTVTSTETATLTPTSTSSPSPSATMSLTPTPSVTSTSSNTPSPTSTSTTTATSTETLTPSPTSTSTTTTTSTETLTPSSSPTATLTPVEPKLLITEVLYDPSAPDPDREWVEIYNYGNQVIDLTNHKIGDEETQGGGEGMYSFPDGTVITSLDVLIIANKATAFQDLCGFLPDFEFNETDPAVPNMNKYSSWSNGNLALNNEGDEILLLGPVNQFIDLLSYGTSTFAFNPSIPDVNEGHSVERYPPNQDTDSSQDWIDQALPNPGYVNQ